MLLFIYSLVISWLLEVHFEKAVSNNTFRERENKEKEEKKNLTVT